MFNVEVTDEMIEKEEQKYKEVYEKRIRLKGFEEGRVVGQKDMIRVIKERIQVYRDIDEENRRLGINMRHCSNTRRINILQELLDNLCYIYDLPKEGET